MEDVRLAQELLLRQIKTLKGIMMKKALIGAWLALTASMVWASCSTHTIMQGGRIVTCTTCCYGGNCTTNCF